MTPSRRAPRLAHLRLIGTRRPSSYWFWGRPSVDDLWHDLRAASSEIRPDWDLSRPGLRGAWDAGDLSPFHGWDRRSPEQVAAAGGPV